MIQVRMASRSQEGGTPQAAPHPAPAADPRSNRAHPFDTGRLRKKTGPAAWRNLSFWQRNRTLIQLNEAAHESRLLCFQFLNTKIQQTKNMAISFRSAPRR